MPGCTILERTSKRAEIAESRSWSSRRKTKARSAKLVAARKERASTEMPGDAESPALSSAPYTQSCLCCVQSVQRSEPGLHPSEDPCQDTAVENAPEVAVSHIARVTPTHLMTTLHRRPVATSF